MYLTRGSFSQYYGFGFNIVLRIHSHSLNIAPMEGLPCSALLRFEWSQAISQTFPPKKLKRESGGKDVPGGNLPWK